MSSDPVDTWAEAWSLVDGEQAERTAKTRWLVQRAADRGESLDCLSGLLRSSNPLLTSRAVVELRAPETAAEERVEAVPPEPGKPTEAETLALLE